MPGDGIKFLIELDSKTKGASDAIRGLGGVGNAAEKANEHIKGMGESGKGLSRDVFTAEFAVHALEHAWEGAKWAAGKVRDIVKETINTVADAERSKMALTNLMGSEGAASSEIKFLEKFSQLTEFSKKTTEGFGISLMKAGYKGQEFEDALAAVADAASLSSDKVEGSQQALSSLTRMKLTGKMDARSLKGLGLDARDVIKDLGGTLGMTPDSVKKLLEKGAVPAAAAYGAVLRALEKKTGKGLGEAGMAAGQTLSAKLTHLGELPERLMAKLEGSPAMERIKDRFDKMLGALDPDSPKGQKIIGGLEHLMDTVANIDFDPLLKGLAGIPGLLGEWVEPISKLVALMGKAAEIILALPTVGEDLGDWVARKLHPELDQTPSYIKAAKEKAEKEAGLPQLRADTAARQALLDKMDPEGSFVREGLNLKRAANLPGVPIGAPLANMAGAAAAPVVSPNVTTHVHVGNLTGTAADVHEAAKTGTAAGLKEAEKQAIRSGARKAKSTLGATSTASGATTGAGAAR